MVDPRKSLYPATGIEIDSARFFSDFPRIQAKPPRHYHEADFRSLPATERQELLTRLIDHVKDL